MDSEQRNPEKEHNPAQNELDLGFSQMEPITPKKAIKSEPSLLERAKGLKGLFTKKEQKNTGNPFAARKEPVFASSAAGDTNMTNDNQTEQTTGANEATAAPNAPHETASVAAENTAETLSPENNQTVEPSQPEIPELTEKPKAGLKNPENWAILSILPQKHRRLFVAILAVVILLIFILWMKPSSDTVQSYEQQSNNDVPIQFQQLDQSQAVEPTVLDNPPPQTENTAAQPNNAENTAGGNAPTEQANATNVAQQTATTAMENKPLETNATAAEPANAATQVKPQETAKPQETVRKPEPAKTEKAKAEKSVKAEQKTTKTVQQTKTQQAKTEQQVVDILEGRSSGTKPAPAGSKTLTVPQGVSLMQVFRDNKLPIGDVSAMTKANGAGNALSSFKPGDKVQVSLNSQGRVSELRLSNGARFIRQSDGSYQFKK